MARAFSFLPFVSSAAVVVAICGGSGSCGSSLQSGGGGASNTGGAGGSGGLAARGGSGGGGRGGGGAAGRYAWAPPSCLANLFAACPIDGACVSHAVAGGASDRLCFASGARAEYTQIAVCPTQTNESVTVTKPDGTVCFTVAITIAGCEVSSYTWTNAAEVVVATGTYGA